MSWTIFLNACEMHLWGFPGSSAGKESAFSVGDQGLTPGLGRSSREGNGYPLQHSCLENPHGQSLCGLPSPWRHKEKDTTERQSTAQHNPFILSNYGREQGIVNKVNTVKQSHTAVPSFLSRILLVMHLISFPHFGLGGDFRHLSLFLVLW